LSIVHQLTSTTCEIEGRVLAFFGGTNYLSLSFHPAIIAAVKKGIEKGGLGLGASRQTTGTSPAIVALEQQVARFAQVEEAVVTGSGMAANIAVIEGFSGVVSTWLADERSHPTFQRFVPVGGARLVQYRHLDLNDFLRKLAEISDRVLGVFTDGVFPLTGEIAPLEGIRDALQGRDHVLVVDEAHSFGVLGPGGRGVASASGLRGKNVIVTATFSKALSCTGGMILGSSEIGQRIRDVSAAYSGSSALAPALCEGASAAIRLLYEDGRPLNRLWENARCMRDLLQGLPLVGGVIQARSASRFAGEGVPIFCLGDDCGIDLEKIHERCMAEGIYVPLVSAYPGMGQRRLLRWIVQSGHTQDEITRLCAVIRRANS
jgi:7-keto-8-aminopelargonate synthetase-like enzyme